LVHQSCDVGVTLCVDCDDSSPLALTNSKHGGSSYLFNSIHLLVFAYLFLAGAATIWHVKTFGRRSWSVLSGERALELIPVAFLDAGVEIFRIKAQEQLSSGTFVVLGNIRLVLVSLLSRVILKRKVSQYQLSALLFVICGILISNSDNITNFNTNKSFALGMHQLI
jgi:drug/metabolite transporter (DMT)-like permease